ncbi:hypothetical protein [Streptomyces sp. enrichment culture]|uniref:hypothetical protein n=1 Tax=Streptomyces sp. enrichment culture TaxID=1795815 RepID=UPI003F550949
METAKERLAVCDREGLWRHEPRRPPAPPEGITQIASVTSCSLDGEHSGFLAHADGWPAILQDIDLFGTADFGTALYAEAVELVRVIGDELELTQKGPDARVVPIGASRSDIDIIAMVCDREPRQPAAVVWLAGGVIERYASFSEFFRGMIAENLAEADALR